jgi:predicted site-specific integrase-resolvase
VNTDNLIGSAEVCDMLGIDRGTLSRWVASGRITPAKQLPGRTGARLFQLSEIEKHKPKLCPTCGQPETA